MKYINTNIFMAYAEIYNWRVHSVAKYCYGKRITNNTLSRISKMPNFFRLDVAYITSLCGCDDIRLRTMNRKFINCRGSTSLSLSTHTACWIIICCTIGNTIIITICIRCTGCGRSTYRVGDKEVIGNIDLLALILDVEVPWTLCEVIRWQLKTRRYCLVVSVENVIC